MGPSAPAQSKATRSARQSAKLARRRRSIGTSGSSGRLRGAASSGVQADQRATEKRTRQPLACAGRFDALRSSREVSILVIAMVQETRRERQRRRLSKPLKERNETLVERLGILGVRKMAGVGDQVQFGAGDADAHGLGERH